MTTDTQEIKLSHEEKLRGIGKRIYEARQLKRISQEEVAGSLKLSLSQVKALETGDWTLLPDGIYAVGFLRQYAKLLDVDLKEEISQLKTNISLSHPVTIPDPAVAPNRRWAIFIFFLFVGLLVYFNMQQQNEEPLTSSLQTPTVAVPAPQNKPLPREEKKPASVPSPSILEQPSPTKVDVYSNIDPVEDATNNAIHHVLLVAGGGNVWLSLSMVDPKTKQEVKLKEMLLHDGQTISLDSPADYLLLTAGNALALTITVDGIIRHKAGTLGLDGKVLRKFTLQLSKTTQQE